MEEGIETQETARNRCRMILCGIGHFMYYSIPPGTKIFMAFYYYPTFNLFFWAMSLVETIMLLSVVMEWLPDRKQKTYLTCMFEDFYNQQVCYAAGLLWSMPMVFIALILSKVYHEEILPIITIGTSLIPLVMLVLGAGTKFALRHSQEHRLYTVTIFWFCIFAVFVPSIAESLIIWFFYGNGSVIQWTVLISDIVQILFIILGTIHCMWQAWHYDDLESSTVIGLKVMFTGYYILIIEFFWCMTHLCISLICQEYLPSYATWLAMGLVLLYIAGIPLSFLTAWLICRCRPRRTAEI